MDYFRKKIIVENNDSDRPLERCLSRFDLVLNWDWSYSGSFDGDVGDVLWLTLLSAGGGYDGPYCSVGLIVRHKKGKEKF